MDVNQARNLLDELASIGVEGLRIAIPYSHEASVSLGRAGWLVTIEETAWGGCEIVLRDRCTPTVHHLSSAAEGVDVTHGQ